MTCILAFQNDFFAMMASDRLIADSWIVHQSAYPKTAKINGWLVGSAGPVRVNNAARHLLDIPDNPSPTERWIVRELVPLIRKQFNETEYVVIDGYLGGKEDTVQGKLLFARPGCIFILHADWAVDVWQSQIAAIGTGERYASSALMAQIGIFGESRLQTMEASMRTSMDIASKSDNYTGKDQIDVISSQRQENEKASANGNGV